MISVKHMVPRPMNRCSGIGIFSISPMTAAMRCTALMPALGSEACAGSPTVSMVNSARPRPARTRLRLEASPMTTKSGVCHSITVRRAAPSMLSSPTDADTMTDPAKLSRSSPPAAWIMAAKAPFMSELPRPQMQPLSTSAANGSWAQALIGTTSTVSMCASNRIVGPS